MDEADINCRADLEKWLIEVRETLDSIDAQCISRDVWIDASQQLIGYAKALGLRGLLGAFVQPIEHPTYSISYNATEQDVRDDLRERIDILLCNLSPLNRQSDTKSDSNKGSRRKYGQHEAKCANLYRAARKQGVSVTLKQVIADYLEQNPSVTRRASTIRRSLEDHPEMYRV